MQPSVDEETRAFLLDEDRLTNFLSRIAARKGRTVSLPELWSVLDNVYRDLPAGPERRLWLRVVLDELDVNGDIAIPSVRGKQWDDTSTIRLPTKITLRPADPRNAAQEWRSFPWHPRLQWVLERRHICRDHVEFLKRVHQCLGDGTFATPEPLKYRSLQLTGDEKLLGRLSISRLFGPGRLSWELLGCQPEVLPIAIERISSGPVLLLFENAAPFMVARQILRASETPATGVRLGCIGYGAGKQMVKSIGYLSMLDPQVETVFYVGDLDAEGIQLAADLRTLSREIPIQPATMFHEAMCRSAEDLGAEWGWPMKETQARQVPDSALAAIAVPFRERCRKMIELGHRIPEEVIPQRVMHRLLSDMY
ncbi:MAG: hypothetical protein AB7O38_20870 [Pirellulaceae bacterium]